MEFSRFFWWCLLSSLKRLIPPMKIGMKRVPLNEREEEMRGLILPMKIGKQKGDLL
jgi:hypothetical protein